MAEPEKAKMGHAFNGAVAEALFPGGRDCFDYHFRGWATVAEKHSTFSS